jgi:hypothetical protein
MIKQALDAYAESLEAKRPVSELRGKTVGASEIGQCMRKVHWRKRSQVEDRGFVQRYGSNLRGNLMEQHFWLPAVKAKYGADLMYAQESFTSGYLSATPDGMLVNLNPSALIELGVEDCGGAAIVECKTIDPRANLRHAKEEHVYQTQVQMGLIRECSTYQPEYAVVSYIDASHWDEVTEFAVKFNAGIYEAAKKRAALIMTAVTAEELPPEGYIAGGQECGWCPFVKPCQSAQQPPADALLRTNMDPQFVAEVTDMCRKILVASAKADAAAQEVKQLKNDVKARLRDKRVTKVPGVVTWSTVKGRTTYDVDAMKAAGIDVTKYSEVGDPTDRLTVAREIENELT